MFLLMIASTIAIAAGDVIFVDDNAPLGGNGQTWETAYKYLQDALADADSSPKPVVIYVAQGVYTPDRGAGNASGDREATFRLINDVSLSGGYAGIGANNPYDQDIKAYETTLSGDLAGNDAPKFANNGENSFHVVTSRGTSETAILDGFTITAGNADGPYPHSKGGGMYNSSSTLMVANCTFSRNSAGRKTGGGRYLDGGGGMYNEYGAPTLRNCTFSGNAALSYPNEGGGMCNYGSGSTLIDCTFTDNQAHSGGGMKNDGYISPTLINCTFAGNMAERYGGGMSNYHAALTLTNCIFSGNTAAEYGAGISNWTTDLSMTNCAFIGNSAGDHGGATCSYDATNLKIANCTFAANSAPNGRALACDFLDGPPMRTDPSNLELINCILWDGASEIWNNDSSTITVAYSDVQGGYPGTANINDNPLFVTGPLGDLYLSQTAAGQLTTSLCVDAGSAPAADIFIAGTTRTDGVNDHATVDMGYHHSAHLRPLGDLHHDGRVDFVDFAKFALYWPQTACGACGGVDLTGEGDVNSSDLKNLADNWLAGLE